MIFFYILSTFIQKMQKWLLVDRLEHFFKLYDFANHIPQNQDKHMLISSCRMSPSIAVLMVAHVL